MRMLLKKSKKLLLLVLTLCVLVTCKSDIVFASNAEGDAQIKLVYDLNTSSFNIGNDTDGDDVVDDFGDKDADGRIMPSTMYNNWTDQTATKFIPFHETSKDDTSTPNERKEKVWARGRTRTWQLYLGYIDEKYITTYDYKNDNTMPWAWTSYYEVLDATQTFTTYTFSSTGVSQGGYLQVRTNIKEAFVDGGEPYYTLKLKVPTAGTYDVSVEAATNTSKNANLYFYMLPASPEASTREQLMNEANLLGNMYSGEKTSTTLDEPIAVSAPGEYYFVVKIEDDKTVPTAKWDIMLKSITLNRVTAEVNGTKYATLQDAIAEADDTDTINMVGYDALTADVISDATITINSGVTLDLNGYTLDMGGNYLTSYGNVVDSSTEKTGRLNVAAAKGTLATSNEQVPIYIDGEGYMFATMKGQSSVSKTEDSFTVISRPSFGDAYSNLAGGADAAKLKFIIRLDWGNDGNGGFTDYQEFEYNNDTVMNVYNVTTPKAFSVTVNGLTGYTENMKVTVLVRSTDLEVDWVNNEFYMSSEN